jgi:hypothetical protein
MLEAHWMGGILEYRSRPVNNSSKEIDNVKIVFMQDRTCHIIEIAI